MPAGAFWADKIRKNMRHPRTRNGFGNRMFADQNFDCPHVSKHRGNHHKMKEEQTPKPARGPSASIGSSTIDSGRPQRPAPPILALGELQNHSKSNKKQFRFQHCCFIYVSFSFIENVTREPQKSLISFCLSLFSGLLQFEYKTII